MNSQSNHDPLDAEWRATLVRLGGSIHQDEDDDLSEDEEAVEQAGIERFQAMLDALTGEEPAEVLEAVLWSLHPIDDYGIYEAVYGAVSLFGPNLIGETAARVVPGWLRLNGNHYSIPTAISSVAYRDEARDAFVDEASSWTADERTRVMEALDSWLREDESWQEVYSRLGGVVPVSTLDPIPADWPDEWRLAAEGFRESGRVDLAWTDERDLPSNFDRVFALLELNHGARWREVGDFLNILLVRRRRDLPTFASALAELPAERREVILAALERSRPGVSEALGSAE